MVPISPVFPYTVSGAENASGAPEFIDGQNSFVPPSAPLSPTIDTKKHFPMSQEETN
jgi:hypothetical protein